MNTVGKMPAVKYSQTNLGSGVSGQGQPFPGGLDLTTPDLRLQPGALRDCLNYECGQFGGYTRIQGYERFDGHASPRLTSPPTSTPERLSPRPRSARSSPRPSAARPAS
jgi:hypothetical protein